MLLVAIAIAGYQPRSILQSNNVDVVNTRKISATIPNYTGNQKKMLVGAELSDSTITADKILGLDVEYFRYITGDKIIDNYEKRVLFDNYYLPSPKEFISTATRYGSEKSSYVELSFYGKVIRQQMWRGFVLTGSGMYGYRYGEETDMLNFDKFSYTEDFLLDKQGSLAYLYYADKKRDSANQPIPVPYNKLTAGQKRIFDITEFRDWEIEDRFILPIDIMSKMSEEAALNSGKYIAFVSTKSPNDIGRRFLLYKGDKFVGVVLVTGTAKRSDWTGLELPTTETFRYYNNPLIIRRNNGVQWGFDFTNKLYKYFEGDGGPTQPIKAVDPD